MKENFLPRRTSGGMVAALGVNAKSHPRSKSNRAQVARDYLHGDDEEYGVVKKPNIKTVTLGNYEMQPWYGNGAFFTDKGIKKELGIEVDMQDKDLSQPHNDDDQYWLDNLYVCEYCFKYTSMRCKFQTHRAVCRHNKPLPTLGRLVYRDDDTPYIVRQIKGFQDPLFCQNLCLFSKLFLVDKSVFYNVDQFEYFVLYGFDDHDIDSGSNHDPNFKPMGFFSKETVSWDGNINLACICIFPPYQRRHLGTLLIELSYAIAKETPGQYFSGPEFPLSAFGKVSYLRFWSHKISVILLENLPTRSTFTLHDIANITGFRKEDIMLTLDYMKVLQTLKNGDMTLLLGNVRKFCQDHHIDPHQHSGMLKDDSLII